ncbi:MAG: hypothetical protein QOF01_415, partial [Thermomicrobiales bacterium]|nr:hypothetical protein [Thermomicrobiales bacterium]
SHFADEENAIPSGASLMKTRPSPAYRERG